MAETKDKEPEIKTAEDGSVEIILDDAPEIEASGKEPEPEIEIVAEPPKKEEPKRQERDVQKTIEKLRGDVDRERRSREEISSRLADAERRAYQANVEARDNEVHLVSNAISLLETEQNLLKNKLSVAVHRQNPKEIADVHTEIANNASKLAQLKNALPEIEQAAKSISAQPLPQRQMSHDERMDVLIHDVGKASPKSAEWLRKNREHITDDRILNVISRAHMDAIDFGVQPDTPEYFRLIEKRIGIKKQDQRKMLPELDEDDDTPPQRNERRSVSPPAAPVSRSAGGPGSSPRSNTVRLTPSQAEAAKIAGISPLEYWKNLQAIEREKAAS